MSVNVYVSDTSVKVAVDVLEKPGSTLEDAFMVSVEGWQDIDPKTVKAAGKLLEDMLSRGEVGGSSPCALLMRLHGLA
jgi:hypothetical protein